MKPPPQTTNPLSMRAAFTQKVDRARTSALRRSDALFKAMASDFLLREQFVTDPTQVLSDYALSGRVSAEQADVSDQLVYAIMSSPELLGWLRTYSSRAKSVPSREQLVRDVLKAAVDVNAHAVVIALARASHQRQDVVGEGSAFMSLLDLIIYGPGGIFAHTEMSTGHTTGTEMSTGHVFVTEMSTGHTTGTEMSTGHVFVTEMSTGHTTGTEMSTGHVFVTEMSTGHTTGTEMSTGHIFSTEMSTGHGTGTEMSTGHTTGTEKSTGHHLGSDIFRPGYQRVALAALVDYSTQLRRAGALDRLFAD
jgi:hypothetical protein